MTAFVCLNFSFIHSFINTNIFFFKKKKNHTLLLYIYIIQLYMENNVEACAVAADLLQSQKALLARSAKEDVDAASVCGA